MSSNKEQIKTFVKSPANQIFSKTKKKNNNHIVLKFEYELKHL